MRPLDIIKMCLSSLTRRKGRTILTVLGVFIGCAAIIIMVSIGAGMKESMDIMISEWGNLTAIDVYAGGNDKAKLNDEAVENFKAIENVSGVMGKTSLDYSISAKSGLNGRYQADWMSVVGAQTNEMDNLGFELLEGKFPSKDDEVVVGQYFAYNFRDSYLTGDSAYRERYKWDNEGNELEPDEPFFNPLNGTVTISATTYEENGPVCTKEYRIVGVLKEDYAMGWETSEGLFMTVNAAKEIKAAMENQTLTTVKTEYNSMTVITTDIDSVTTVEEAIKDLGYNTSSMASYRESIQDEMRQIELMLGGLGAISLLVAAIGIANTMTMSITERTKEIGIMKALGCYVRDIRAMFLLEAGSIGLLGGITGLIFSYLVSVVINLITFGALNSTFSWEYLKYALVGNPEMARTSVINPGLAIFALLFSFLVGLISGYRPANNAVKISALEAIKNE